MVSITAHPLLLDKVPPVHSDGTIEYGQVQKAWTNVQQVIPCGSDPTFAAQSDWQAPCDQESTSSSPGGTHYLQRQASGEMKNSLTDYQLEELMQVDIYLIPEQIEQTVSTTASTEQTLELDNPWCVQVTQPAQDLTCHDTLQDVVSDSNHCVTSPAGTLDTENQCELLTPQNAASSHCQTHYSESDKSDELIDQFWWFFPQATATDKVISLQTTKRGSRKRKWVSEAPPDPVDPAADANLDRIVQQIRHDLTKIHQAGVIQSRGGNGKVKVHEVVYTLLFARLPRPNEVSLMGIITFCNQDGVRTDQVSKHFTVLDTMTLGCIWQKIKGNSTSNYDTFARAIRVSREQGQKYFGYLESGPGSKKRIYALGDVGYSEVKNLAETLRD